MWINSNNGIQFQKAVNCANIWNNIISIPELLIAISCNRNQVKTVDITDNKECWPTAMQYVFVNTFPNHAIMVKLLK